MNDFFYRKLTVYQKAIELTDYIYDLIRYFPDYERYALSDQIRRAAISIPSNISEGMGRFAIKERTHFLEIAYGSLTEVLCQSEIALRRHYISDEQFNIVEKNSETIAKMLSGLKNSLNNKM